jgi:hypothetical protein
MKKQLFQSALMMGSMLLSATVVLADPPGSGGGAGAPIDGGISLLVAAGASYGINKLRKNRKAKNEGVEK